MGVKPSTDAVRALYQSDLGRGELSREVESSRESRYPPSEDGYMRFFLTAKQGTVTSRNGFYGEVGVTRT